MKEEENGRGNGTERCTTEATSMERQRGAFGGAVNDQRGKG
jgi:hypothetical protein